MPRLFYGALISPTSLTEYLALPHALVCVSDAGEIEWIEEDVPASALQEVLAKHGQTSMALDCDLLELKTGEFLMPGFVDTHTHAPQLPNMGSGQQDTLLDWLNNTTFPMEARFANEKFARTAYELAVRRIIDCGTTTCCYYGTLHLGSTRILADIVHAHGQRAFVGKCNMDRPGQSPSYYIEKDAGTSLADTHALIHHIRSLHSHTVQPILTPRFALSCTDALLAGLQGIALGDQGLAIQTHIAENPDEIALVKKTFPVSRLPPPRPAPGGAEKKARGTYAGVYDAYGLLRHNTVLAHAVHLEEAEVDIIKARNAGISHCPTSNLDLRSGCAKVGWYLDKGVKVGLGTDVSGGSSPSILRTIQDASTCAKVVSMQAKDKVSPSGFANKQLPIATLLHLATLGGAQVCGLASHIGQIARGRAFDALVVSVRGDAGNPAIWGADTDMQLRVHASGGESGCVKSEKDILEGLVERFLLCGDDRNVRRVYVQGKLIGGKEHRA